MFNRGAFLALTLIGGLLLNTTITPVAQATTNAITQLVPFQGRLHDSEGKAVPDGVYDLTYYIYDTATGGEFKWSENHSQVSVIHGYVNVLLGGTPGGDFASSNVDFSTQKYLSISINGGQEMFPRHQLVPTFHAYDASKFGGKEPDHYATDAEVIEIIERVDADISDINTDINTILGDRFVNSGNTAINSDKLDNLKSTDFIRSTQINDLVPIGTVLMWPASGSIPVDYKECNGEPLDRGTFSVLYSIIGNTYGAQTINSKPHFKLPDYRGLFLRGWAHGSSDHDPDYNRGIGSIQGDSFKKHKHKLGIPRDAYGSSNNFSLTQSNGSDESIRYDHYSDEQGGAETRPKNRAVMYIIKYK
jgi:hypothetical protein